MWSASRPWPHASWNRTPPLPLLRTTGTTPLGAGRADSLRMARSRGQPGQLLDVVACRTAPSRRWRRSTRGRSACRCRRSPRRTPRTGSSPGRRRPGRLRCWPPGSAGGCRRRRRSPGGSAPPAERAASSARRSSSTLAALGTVSGRIVDLGWGLGRRPGTGRPGGPRRRHCGPRRRPPRPRARRPGLRQVGGVGEAGGLADDHPDPGAALAARGQLLDPAVVEPGGRAAPVLGEHLGETRRLSATPPRAPAAAPPRRSRHSFSRWPGAPSAIGSTAKVPAYRGQPCRS